MARQRRVSRERRDRASRPRAPRREPQKAPTLPLLVVGVLAAVGVGLTAYLSVVALTHGDLALCEPGSGCDIVQSSRYARLLGVPVALIGLAGFAAIGVLAVAPLSWRARGIALYGLGVGGFAFSSYLTVLEFFVIRAICPYCIATFGVMTAILAVLLLLGRAPALLPGARSAVLGIAIAATVVAGSAAIQSNREAVPETYAAALAKHLASEGAVMYGAYWCPHCQSQKEMFGDAFRYVNYVECDPGGKDAQPFLCEAKGIRGYPTWEVHGAMYEGVQTLDMLASLTSYGPTEP